MRRWMPLPPNDCMGCHRIAEAGPLCQHCRDMETVPGAVELAAEGLGPSSISVRLNKPRRNVLATLARAGAIKPDGTVCRETAGRARG